MSVAQLRTTACHNLEQDSSCGLKLDEVSDDPPAFPRSKSLAWNALLEALPPLAARQSLRECAQAEPGCEEKRR
jgi:hypothetical protein